MLRTSLLYLSRKPGFGNFLAKFQFTKRTVRRFVPGFDLDEAAAVLERLTGEGKLSAITYLGENVTTEKDARGAAATYRTIVERIAAKKVPCVPSLKVTHMGLDLSEKLCLENCSSILDAARPHGIRVWFDMEGSPYTDKTLAVVRKLREKHENIAAVLQAYLYRTEKDLESLIPLGIGVRLCKGCYKEPASIAFPRKADVDANYAKLAERMLSPDALGRGLYPGLATHDPKLVAKAISVAKERAIPSDKWEFQMLYGIGSQLHPGIRDAGARLRVLVPYGSDWYGFFMRRLAERPANVMFFLKHSVSS